VHRVGKLGSSEARIQTKPSDHAFKKYAALLRGSLSAAVMTAASWSSLRASMEPTGKESVARIADGLPPAVNVNV